MSAPAPAFANPFHHLLREQVRHEFTASHQHVAIAVHLDAAKLPRLAAVFYDLSADLRRHALMLVQYLLDVQAQVPVASVDPIVEAFDSVGKPVELALTAAQADAERYAALSAAAVEMNDYAGERFVGWFLAAQSDQVAQLRTLRNIVARAADNLFDVEEFLARADRAAGEPPAAPAVAGAGR
ncbi:MAG TPA: ferritin-like domain-containing protein [Aldersonia sp.]